MMLLEGLNQEPPQVAHAGDLPDPNPDEVMAFLKGRDRTTKIALVTGAMIICFGVGWVCAVNMRPSLVAVTQARAPRAPEMKLARRTDDARKTASNLQNPPRLNPVLTAPAAALDRQSNSGRPSADAASVPPAIPVNVTLAPREPMTPIAETRPTTIEGWAVVDVRGGTIFLQGPNGALTATRGDTVPGIGQIESVVRWGNRWIVATASGLIATP